MSRHFSLAAVVAGAAVLVAPFVSPEVVSATTVDQQRAEVARIVDQLDALHAQADMLAEEYNAALVRQEELDGEIADAEQRVAAKETELTELQGDLAEVAVAAYTGAGSDVLGPLFSNAEAYTETLRESQYSRAALDAGTATVDDLDELISELTAERKHLADLRDEVVELQQTISSKQARTEELLAQYTTARAEAEAKLGRLIEEEEQRRAAAAWAALQRQYAESQSNASNNSGNSGGGTSGGGDTGGGSSGGTSTGGGGATSSGGGSGSGGGAAPTTNIPSVSGRAGVAIAAAQSQLGVPYRYAQSKPGVAFDCSGLTAYAWGQAGVGLPHQSRAQAASVPRIPAGAAQPGDLIFYYNPISHVGIYIGGGSMIHAPATGQVVKVASVNWGKVTAVGRPG